MNPAALAFSNWSFNLEVGLTTIITFMVQAFFARRAWFCGSTPDDFISSYVDKLRRLFSYQAGWRSVCTDSKNAAPRRHHLSLTQLGFGLATFAYAWILGEFVKYLDYRWLVACWLGSAAVCDVLIVYMLSTALMTQRTGFGRTDALVNKLLRYAVNTGLLTSIFAILDLVTFCTMPNFVHLAFNFVLGKLYTNTLLATLNAREIAQKPNIIHIEDGSYRLGEFQSSRTTGTIKFNHPVDTCASQDPGKEIGMTTHPTIRISEDDRGPSSELHGNA
ncbi:Transmembrane protein [Ceratobasidium theobromae]|uniref:Transmembrane protein n=1 Tax=Ceratobasidium theobromae TaxID=1582974 RepID=A0A5N5QEY1_9AGAM|nr:Transmembrane protein [Ceratobasidium theobromae]